MVDMDEVLYGVDDIEADLDALPLNPLTSTISKLRNFKLLKWAQPFNLVVDMDQILYGGDGTEYYLGYILLNLVASTIPKFFDV
jgi:hypothetical protein